jgi:hypothetical protein
MIGKAEQEEGVGGRGRGGVGWLVWDVVVVGDDW